MGAECCIHLVAVLRAPRIGTGREIANSGERPGVRLRRDVPSRPAATPRRAWTGGHPAAAERKALNRGAFGQ